MQAKTRVNFIVAVALFSVLAAVVGLLEALLPLQLIIPVPGVKLGIANVIIVITFVVYGAKTALTVTIIRTLLVFLFSGNPISFLISLSGGIFSFICLCLFMKLRGRLFTYIGVSAICAVSHGIGQMCAAYFTVGKPVLYYLPCLCFFSAITGVFTGTLLNIIFTKFLNKY